MNSTVNSTVNLCEPKDEKNDAEIKDESTDSETGRDKWGSKMDFILSCLGYAIGLGNVWRFPYMCFTNGGGAFLMVYLLMLSLAALPVMVLEMLFGQFSNLGCVSVWRMSPLFKGIGFGMALISMYFCMYYNIIIAYTIYYMVASFKNPLPWSHCGNEWNSENCYTDASRTSNISATDASVTDASATDVTPFSTEDTMPDNSSKVWAAEEFWENHVLGMTSGLHDLGGIRWELLGCFWLAWIVVYFCIIKGVKTSGKVVYFTAVFPFVVLFILLIRGVTLEGAGQGIIYFIKPNFEKLMDARVWTAAANQVFISFGAGWGGVLTLASYNDYRNNSIRDCMILVSLGALTSVMAGFVVFSVLGFMAHDTGLAIEDVVRAGPGLTFIAYPEALSRLPLPQLWSVIFFFMLFTLGLDSQFVTLETVITAIVDELSEIAPWVQKKRFFIILGTCASMAVIGLPLCFEGGIYVEQLLDWYSAGFSPIILGLIEIVVICHVYGYRKFRQDLRHMLGFYPNNFWFVCWLVIAPLLIVVVLIYTFVDYTPASLGDYSYPPWAQAIGWFLTFTSILCIICYAIYNVIYLQTGTIKERIIAASKPAPEWGPSHNAHRIEAGYRPLPGRGAKSIPGDTDTKV
ncbi:sodium- and chloride-dependent glycine transporter 1-like isoform X2 [Apostichopus japonicus]|uniref:sodium- and chloride-dependent glycine transporter 1-like isoform X2 n=1 Tax=Stichopus japonicus TaxID=307972 RepID=UPI003AB91645